ncbi:MAG: hypothetical protein CM15mP49_09710 [Actinomycetota bacterium]|nr:MAG: hypothetical protein CM15mP49_09710 [Actinomycetota bacterium]
MHDPKQREAGTGNVIQAVRHLRTILGDIKKIGQADSAELYEWAKQLQAPVQLVEEVAETGSLPVPCSVLEELLLRGCSASYATRC